MSQESQTYRYAVDAADRLVWVDDWWLAFARENGAPELTADAVYGRSLWDFVTAGATQQLYAQLHARVRATRQRVVVPFRCDSPRLKRHMRLTIVPQDEGRLDYESVLLRTEPQSALPVLDATRPRSEAVLTTCSCCKRALLESVGWLELEEVAVRLRLFEKPKPPQLRYAVCPGCHQAVEEEAENGSAA